MADDADNLTSADWVWLELSDDEAADYKREGFLLIQVEVVNLTP